MGDNRTLDQLRQHFRVEKELAERLRRSSRDERRTIYATLYNELFDRVPDHPRLITHTSKEEVERTVRARMAIVAPHVRAGQTVVEFAPGDCCLSFELCRTAAKVIGIDISDQSGADASRPANFELVIYDGYELNLPDAVADLAFSYQFLEHLHPDDIDLHFATAFRLLKPGGCYVFATPHRFSGPHDVSRNFTVNPEGFHLQEWTFRSMRQHLRRAGFAADYAYRSGRCRRGALWNWATDALEMLIGLLPRRLQQRVSQRLFASVTMMAVKGGAAARGS